MSEAAYHQIRTGPSGPPPGCPVDHSSFRPLSAEYVADPYPTAARLREETPVVFAEDLGYVVVSRMADVTEVFMNPDVYSSENVQDPVFPLCDEAAAILADPEFDPVAVMSNRQEPDHGRIRQYTKKGFSNRRNKVLEPYIRRRAGELIDEMIAGGPPADFVAAVANPLPGEVVFRFMGFPESDDAQLKEWCGDRLAFSWGRPTPDEQVEIATKMVAYWKYVREFTARKRDQPGDDLASELLADHEANPDDLTYREVESILYGLSFAGHEPVTLYLGNALLTLLPRREVWDAMCADPAVVPLAMEEVIRWNSPQVGWRRVTTEDTTLGGVDIPAGTQVFLNLGAANHDPAVFEDPERYDLERSNARQNISFGKGNHYCLGAMFARLEANAIMETLTQQLPSMRLVHDQQVTRFPNITFRGPSRLDVTWDG
ncbi:MAG: cytochrome P450 [Ilumatobacter sp.]|uniref:cytochrome P450 n=1 Tax=Ilumatobacter sp. TaxID=1967498 RepID=UPI002631AA06|nr:cytochrome P450 [Ilumatobacter sp.]MDJ0767354.1 cytochrome P450 [Ilumatobacter sp.]